MACLPRKLFEIQNLDAAVSFSERMHIIDITEDFTGTDACLATGAGQDFFSKGGAQAELSIGSGV